MWTGPFSYLIDNDNNLARYLSPFKVTYKTQIFRFNEIIWIKNQPTRSKQFENQHNTENWQQQLLTSNTRNYYQPSRAWTLKNILNTNWMLTSAASQRRWSMKNSHLRTLVDADKRLGAQKPKQQQTNKKLCIGWIGWLCWWWWRSRSLCSLFLIALQIALEASIIKSCITEPQIVEYQAKCHFNCKYALELSFFSLIYSLLCDLSRYKI